MGSFSVSCSGSGMSITSGDKAIFIPLVSAHGKTVTLEPMSMIVSNDGVSSLYKPFSLPIFGEYNDYGSMENIERNTTVEEIERFFNITIDEFLEVVTRNWCEDNTKDLKTLKNKEVLQRMSGCFVNREIYDYMVNETSHSEGSYNFLEGADVSTQTLIALGFKNTETKENGRYNKVWMMDGDEKNKVYSDGTWSSINTSDHSGLYHPDKFIKEWNKVSDVKIDMSKFLNLSKYHFAYDGVVNSLKPTDSRLEEIMRGIRGNDIRYALPISSWEYGFEKLYKARMITGDDALKKDFLDFFSFQNTMWVNNKIYMPMYSGPQCGDPEAQLKLAKTMVKILSEQSKSRE